MSALFLGLGALAAVAALPSIVGGERKNLNDAERRRLPGRFARLDDGHTGYELEGPSPAETVVFVHGISSPSYVWGELPKMLRDAGYATLTYDLYGRGWSDRPRATYDLDLFDRQLVQLLRKLDVREKVHVVGLSMGGIVSSEFTLRHADSVASLTLVDPAGFAINEPPGAWMMRVPVFGDWLMQVVGDRVLTQANANNLYDKSLVPGLVQRFAPQLEYTGYKRAMLSTMRHMPLADFRSRYEDLGRTGVPVEVFWGEEDTITPISGLDVAAKLLPHAKLLRLAAAGHLAHYEKTEDVARLLVEFLRANPAPARDSVR